jgi:LmbE family N-acetylglucosaminyl deacetylase
MIESELYPYRTSDFSDRDCLVIAPHPDDESIGCGGSIVRHRKKGSRVKIIFLTSGDKGDFQGVFGDDYLKTRRESARKAVSVLGVEEYEFWEFGDRELYREKDSAYERLRQEAGEFKPEVIYVPSPYEVNPDHRTASSLGWRLYEDTGACIAFYEILMSVHPNVLVDISEEFRKKEKAIRCYATELHYNDYVDKVKGLNRFRTATLSQDVQYAESFILVDGTTRTDRSVRLLKEFLRLD